MDLLIGFVVIVVIGGIWLIVLPRVAQHETVCVMRYVVKNEKGELEVKETKRGPGYNEYEAIEKLKKNKGVHNYSVKTYDNTGHVIFNAGDVNL